MCGIVGFLGSVGPAGQDAAVVRRMADQLRHRGPDDEGGWADEAAGIALAQRRLSIVDLSPAGHQPMLSACTGTVAATTCVESNVPGGQWKYSVTPVFGTTWQGAESLRVLFRSDWSS